MDSMCHGQLLFIAVLCAFLNTALSGNSDVADRAARIKHVTAELRDEDGRVVFPRTIDGQVLIRNRGNIDFHGKLVHNLRLPNVEELSPGGVSKQRRVQMKDTAFYTGPEGEFACKAKYSSEGWQCDMVGLLQFEDETCFLARDRAYCSPIIPGEEMVLDPVTDEILGSIIREPGPSTEQEYNTDLYSDTYAISVALYLDKPFVDRFKTVNDGNFSKGMQDMEEFCILMANQWTRQYQLITQYPSWPTGFDFAVNIVKIVYPQEDEDFHFLQNDAESRTDIATILEFADDSGVQALLEGEAHHVMLITGSEPPTPDIIGLTYDTSICNVTYSDKRVSLRRNMDFNFADDQALEIANAAENCLHRIPNDFLNNFCFGPLGRLNFTSVAEQCERWSGPGCDTSAEQRRVSPHQCRQPWSVQCCTRGNTGMRYTTLLYTIEDGTLCEGSDPTADYICYNGECTDIDEMCGNLASSTTTMTSESTTASISSSTVSTVEHPVTVSSAVPNNVSTDPDQSLDFATSRPITTLSNPQTPSTELTSTTTATNSPTSSTQSITTGTSVATSDPSTTVAARSSTPTAERAQSQTTASYRPTTAATSLEPQNDSSTYANTADKTQPSTLSPGASTTPLTEVTENVSTRHSRKPTTQSPTTATKETKTTSQSSPTFSNSIPPSSTRLPITTTYDSPLSQSTASMTSTSLPSISTTTVTVSATTENQTTRSPTTKPTESGNPSPTQPKASTSFQSITTTSEPPSATASTTMKTTDSSSTFLTTSSIPITTSREQPITASTAPQIITTTQVPPISSSDPVTTKSFQSASTRPEAFSTSSTRSWTTTEIYHTTTLTEPSTHESTPQSTTSAVQSTSAIDRKSTLASTLSTKPLSTLSSETTANPDVSSSIPSDSTSTEKPDMSSISTMMPETTQSPTSPSKTPMPNTSDTQTTRATTTMLMSAKTSTGSSLITTISTSVKSVKSSTRSTMSSTPAPAFSTTVSSEEPAKTSTESTMIPTSVSISSSSTVLPISETTPSMTTRTINPTKSPTPLTSSIKPTEMSTGSGTLSTSATTLSTTTRTIKTTAVSPTKPPHRPICHCDKPLCREWRCYRGDKTCCQELITDTFFGIADFRKIIS